MVTPDDALEIAARDARAWMDAERACRQRCEKIAHLLHAARLGWSVPAGLSEMLDAAIAELRQTGTTGTRVAPPNDDQEDVE